MFQLNVAPVDLFTLAHALMPFLIARSVASREALPGSWRPVLVVVALIAVCEPYEAFLAGLGIESFRESAVNIAADVAVGLASGALGVRAGRRRVGELARVVRGRTAD